MKITRKDALKHLIALSAIALLATGIVVLNAKTDKINQNAGALKQENARLADKLATKARQTAKGF